MVHLSLLGPLRVEAPDGTSLDSLARSSKRLALLAYLVVEGLGEFHRRDTLIGFLWPELPERKARASLRSTLRYLREDLGDQVLVNRGRDEVALDAEHLRVDVAEFRGALAEEDFRSAAKLYRGELLKGFHLDDAPEFQEWLDLRRRELHDRGLEAMARVADEAMAAGQELEGVRWARRAVSAAPLNEAAARRLIRLLARHGHRAAAQEAFLEFRARLSDQLGLEPEEETIQALSAQEPRSPVASQSDTEVTSVATAVEEVAAVGSPVAAPSAVGAGPAQPRDWWRFALFVVVAVGLFTAFSIGEDGGPAGGALSAGGEMDGDLVAVLPFNLESAPDLGYLGEGMVDLLSFKLSLPGGLRTVPSSTVLTVLDDISAPSDLERGVRLVQVLGAGGFVSGRMVQLGGDIEITATLHGADGSALFQTGATADGESALPRAVDELTRELIAGRLSGPEDQVARSAVLSGTESLDALRAFLAGEMAFREARFAEARSHYQKALEADTGFALGYVRLTAATKWTNEYDLMTGGVRSAMRRRDRLGERERLLVEADQAWWIDGDVRRALETLRVLAERFPQDLEGQYALGDLIFHQGPRLGIAASEGEPRFRAVLAFDPNHGDALLHLLRLRAGPGSTDEVRSLAEGILSSSRVPSRSLEARAHLAAKLEDDELWGRIEGGMAELTDPVLGSLVSRVIEWNPTSRVGRRGIDELLTPGRSLEARAQAGMFMVASALATGRPAEARHYADEVARVDEVHGWASRVMVALNPLVPAAPDTLVALVDAVPPWDGAAADFGISTTVGSGRFEAFQLALLSARLGDSAGVDRWARRRARLDPAVAADKDPAHLWLATAEGRATEVLAQVGEPWPGESTVLRWLSWSQYIRAEALHASGRLEEALRWYRAARQDGYLWWHLAPAVHLRSGEILEALDRLEEAAEEYRAFLSLLEEAEPQLHSLRANVRVRLARIR